MFEHAGECKADIVSLQEQEIKQLQAQLEKAKAMNKLMETHHGTLSMAQLQAELEDAKEVINSTNRELHRRIEDSKKQAEEIEGLRSGLYIQPTG